MEFFVTGGLFLMVAVWFNRKLKGAKVILPRELQENDDDEDGDLMEIPSYKEYEEETRVELEQFHAKLDHFGLTKEMKEETRKIREELEQKKAFWSSQEKEVEQMIEERKTFITTETMYPRNYALSLSDLEVFLEKIKDYRHKNPYKKDYELLEKVAKEKDLVSDFLKTKKRIEDQMEAMAVFEKGLKGPKEEVDYFTEKQKMYLHLMNGETKEAKESLKKIIKKINAKKP